MKFTTENENEIAWMRNPDNYDGVREVVHKIKAAKKWEEFLQNFADPETNEIDCDDLYDYLRFESEEALLDVGLHYTQATATVEEVTAEWEKDNPDKKIFRTADGKPKASIYSEYLEFDLEGGNDTVVLDTDEVLELMRNKHHGNANKGEWDCEDPEAAEFEMWRARE